MYMGSIIHGIGTDIIEIERIRTSIEKYGEHFISKIFTDKEREYCSKKPLHLQPVHYAARFAAKEAFAKALGTGIGEAIEFRHIGIHNTETGRPIIELEKPDSPFLLLYDFHCSISHTHIYAIATVIIERKDENAQRIE